MWLRDDNVGQPTTFSRAFCPTRTETLYVHRLVVLEQTLHKEILLGNALIEQLSIRFLETIILEERWNM